MKILFFIDSLNAGGKERRFVELLKGLNKLPDIDFEIVVMDKNIHYKEVFGLGKKIHFIIRKTKKDLSIFIKFYKVCKKAKPDIVHCFDSMSAVYLIPAIYLQNIYFINGMVSDAPARLDKKNWFRTMFTFPFSSMIIGNSKAGLKAYSTAPNKSLVIQNGYNFERKKNLLNSNDIRSKLGITTRFVIGMVASFSSYKDYKTYFKAAEQILSKRNDITFLAIGKNTDSEEAKKLIGKKFYSSIKLLGKRFNIESYINLMDVCVLATFTEGISNAIIEYMACGKPVVATDGGGTNEIVEDGKTGFLVRVSDVQMLTDKITMLLNDANLRNDMGKSGQKRVEEEFSITHMVAQYVEAYSCLINRKRLSNNTTSPQNRKAEKKLLC